MINNVNKWFYYHDMLSCNLESIDSSISYEDCLNPGGQDFNSYLESKSREGVLIQYTPRVLDSVFIDYMNTKDKNTINEYHSILHLKLLDAESNNDNDISIIRDSYDTFIHQFFPSNK